jgi:hypothetical protein
MSKHGSKLVVILGGERFLDNGLCGYQRRSLEPNLLVAACIKGLRVQVIISALNLLSTRKLLDSLDFNSRIFYNLPLWYVCLLLSFVDNVITAHC